MKPDIDKEHADHTQQQACYAGYLHSPRQVKPLPQIGNLCGRHRRMTLLMLLFQSTYKTGIGQKRLVYANIIKDIAENSKAGVVKSISIKRFSSFF